MNDEVRVEEASAEDVAAVVEIWREAGLTRPWNDPVSDAELARVPRQQHDPGGPSGRADRRGDG